MYHYFGFILCVTCLEQVISKPTSDPTYSYKCGENSSEVKGLLQKMQQLETNINRLEQLATFVAPATFTFVICDIKGIGINLSLDTASTMANSFMFQRRQDGSENFNRNWTDYQNGFGRLDGEFWMGNDALAAITNRRSYELRVELEDFDGNKRYAVYSTFSIAQAEDKYRLSLGSYSGNAGDSLSYHSGRQFTINDQDNDEGGSNCAVKLEGAWWFYNCHRSDLNGQYLRGAHESSREGVYWLTFKGYYYSLKMTEMKIRPK